MYFTILKNRNGLHYQDFEKEEVLIEYLRIYYRYFSSKDSLDILHRQAQSQIKGKTFQSNLHSIKRKIKSKIKTTLSTYPELCSALNIDNRYGKMSISINRSRIENLMRNMRI